MSLPQSQYHIFAPRSGLVASNENIYADAYDCWRSIWADVFKEVSHHGDLSADEFIRHDRCCVLTIDSQVAGVHLYSFFDLSNRLQLKRRYLTENFDAFSINTILNRGCERAMTMEYLSVSPHFRGANIAQTMIGSGLRVFLSEPDLEGVIACTRNSRKVNQMATDYGFQTLARDRVAHGETADLIYFPRGDILTPNEIQARQLNQLWQARNDTRYTAKDKANAA